MIWVRKNRRKKNSAVNGSFVYAMVLACISCGMIFSAVASKQNTSGNPPSDLLQDPDQDGFSNQMEYLLGTNPLDAGSHPTLADNGYKVLAYWPLATNATEAFGSGLDGSLRNGASFIDSALILDGKDDYVSFGNTLSVTGSISLCVWINPGNAEGLTRVLGKFRAKDRNCDYAVFLCDGRLWIFFSDDGTPCPGHSILQVSTKCLKKKEWVHLAVTWDVTKSADGVSCYFDGEKVQMLDLVSSGIKSIHSGSADLTLGSYDIYTVICGKKKKEIVDNAFKGSMAQLILCDDVLTVKEVREIFLLGRNGDLLAYLEMDSDMDGIPDWWERVCFGDLKQTAEGDFDSDGLSNIEEFRHGTDPATADTDGDGFNDGLEVSAGSDPKDPGSRPAAVGFKISGSISYGAYSIGTIYIMAVSGSNQVTVSLQKPGNYLIENVPANRSWTVKAWCDFNGNGLNDLSEPSSASDTIFLATDLTLNFLLSVPDIDHDGMPDWWEMLCFGNLGQEAAGDSDNDGVGNLQEYQYNTDPKKPTELNPPANNDFNILTPLRSPL